MDVPSAASLGTIASLAQAYQALVNATVTLQTVSVSLAGTFTFTTTNDGSVRTFNFVPFTAAESNAVLGSIGTVLQNRLSLAQNALSVLPTVTVTSTFGQGPQPVSVGTSGATGATGP